MSPIESVEISNSDAKFNIFGEDQKEIFTRLNKDFGYKNIIRRDGQTIVIRAINKWTFSSKVAMVFLRYQEKTIR